MQRQVDLSKLYKEFKIEFDNDFTVWANTLPKDIPFIQQTEIITEFPKEIQYPLIQILENIRLKRSDYKYIIVTVIPPASKYTPHGKNEFHKIEAAEQGHLDRVLSVVGFREKFTFKPIVTVSETPGRFLFPGNCMHFYNGIGSGIELLYDDKKSSLRPARDGYRSGVQEKKDPMKRIIIMVDIVPSDDRLLKTMNGIQEMISNPKTKKNRTQPFQVSANSEIPDETEGKKDDSDSDVEDVDIDNLLNDI